jgi:hypothetical protein
MSSLSSKLYAGRQADGGFTGQANARLIGAKPDRTCELCQKRAGKFAFCKVQVRLASIESTGTTCINALTSASFTLQSP